MIKCEHCGAAIPPDAYECPYCKAPTRRAAEHRARQDQEAHARAQWETHQQYAQQQVLGRQLESTAKQSLVWAIVSFVTCCTPLAVVGVVQGFRARGMATRLGTPVPSVGKIGFVLSLLACVSSLVLLTVAMIQGQVDKETAGERTAQLKKQIQGKASAAQMDHPTACALAEIYARETGFDRHPGYSLDQFQCIGKLSSTPDDAELVTFRFRWSSTPYDVNACFKKGATDWYVTELRKGSCPR